MDKMIYLAMTSAKHVELQQATTANNLANIHTTGFKAELNAFRALPVVGDGAPTRIYQVDNTVGHDLSQGAMQLTGNNFDFAIAGPGFFAVEAPNGGEAYTRDGGFLLDSGGVLRTRTGMAIAGDGGQLVMPQGALPDLRQDGTLFAIPANGGQPQEIGKLKLVNPVANEVYKGEDGLFRLNSGQDADADPTVKVKAGYLEGSNVNAVDSLVQMISHAKHYDLSVKLMQNAEQNSKQATQILSVS
ncbi:flagellar basal body rod protein FlgF [Vogesella sp. DC21W]|uniref:Flagellar basal-body rod protein FlgF n=1 Tax=Vogesella aquatica TaxID=2984206 RepID=A0ABT5J106_9NEIS|nr:flagellar basal body rod protein FlgF [Vogesella aquatica]MDC7718501.1 flagellar basal body rod protein FlgF [Vogesella aquatica]